jgi:hypothetical protein
MYDRAFFISFRSIRNLEFAKNARVYSDKDHTFPVLLFLYRLIWIDISFMGCVLRNLIRTCKIILRALLS